MNCIEFRNQLESCIEAHAVPAIEVQLHGEECAEVECRSTWEDFVLLEAAIGDWKAGLKPVAARPAPRRTLVDRSAAVAVRATLAVAACFCGAVFILPHLDSRTDLQSTNGIAPSLQSVSYEAPATEISAGAEVRSGLSIDWIAVAPIRVSSSMASVLLGSSEASVEAPAEQTWLNGWRQQWLPIEENFEVIRGLLIENQENQT